MRRAGGRIRRDLFPEPHGLGGDVSDLYRPDIEHLDGGNARHRDRRIIHSVVERGVHDSGRGRSQRTRRTGVVLVSGSTGDEQVRINPHDPAILRFDGKGRASGYDGCNWFGGKVTLEPGRAVFGDAAGTMRACGDADTTGVPATDVMPPHGDYTAEFDGEQLVLSRDDTVLIFEVAASIWPSDRGSDKPNVLDEGEHCTGDYRLTWSENLDKKNADLDQWSLQIESRAKPGVQIG